MAGAESRDGEVGDEVREAGVQVFVMTQLF